MPMAPSDPPAICYVLEHRSENLARVSIRVEALREISGKYLLIVGKKGLTGNAFSQQRGEFHIAAGSKLDLGRTAINISDDTELWIDGLIILKYEHIKCKLTRL